MAGMIDRDEIVQRLLKAGVEPPLWLDEWLADNDSGLAGQCVFLPSPQGLVPVIFWTDGLNRVINRIVKGLEDDGGND